MRFPSPHSGAVRNSLGPACPCETPSARPTPMSCSSRSEKRLTCERRSAATLERPEWSAGVWHSAQPTYTRSEEHTSELQSRLHLVCRLLLEKKKKRSHI